MAIKHWQILVKGQPDSDEIERCVGEGGGLITRVHSEGGQTQIYLAGDATSAKKAARALKGARAPKEVRVTQVKKMG